MMGPLSVTLQEKTGISVSDSTLPVPSLSVEVSAPGVGRLLAREVNDLWTAISELQTIM